MDYLLNWTLENGWISASLMILTLMVFKKFFVLKAIINFFSVSQLIYILYKKLGNLHELKNLLKEADDLDNLKTYTKLLSHSHKTFVFSEMVLPVKSQTVFNVLKAIYDKEYESNISIKRISFKFYQLEDNDTLYANLMRFIDYYIEKNSIRIVFFLHPSKVKTDLENYLLTLDPQRIKITIRKEREIEEV